MNFILNLLILRFIYLYVDRDSIPDSIPDFVKSFNF